MRDLAVKVCVLCKLAPAHYRWARSYGELGEQVDDLCERCALLFGRPL